MTVKQARLEKELAARHRPRHIQKRKTDERWVQLEVVAARHRPRQIHKRTYWLPGTCLGRSKNRRMYECTPLYEYGYTHSCCTMSQRVQTGARCTLLHAPTEHL